MVFGPVFAYEWLLTTRRWQIYALRAGFVSILLAAILLVWKSNIENEISSTPSSQRFARIGESLFGAIMGTQLSLVLLAAPAATAGSICMDKARGSLVHLLVTDLSDTEIVLGKLAARLAPVFGLIVASVPVLFLVSFLGGIDLEALISAYLILSGVVVLSCSLALLLSIWGSKTHEVLLVSYLIVIGWLLTLPVYSLLSFSFGFAAPPSWLDYANPYWLIFAPYSNPNATDLSDAAYYFLVTTGLAAIMLLIAIVKMRSVTVHQAGRAERAGPAKQPRAGRARDRRFGPSLDRNPVLWLEWHRRRPSRWMRIVWRSYALGMIAFTVLALVSMIASSRRHSEMPVIVTGFGVAIGLLLVSVTAVTALADERVRGSLDVLLATPLSTASIVWGKWWGAYRVVPLLAVLPGILGFLVASTSGQFFLAVLLVGLILAYGAFVTSLGLALATWLRRFGRAVVLSVSAYAFMVMGWPLLVITLFNRRSFDDFFGTGLALASPLFGPLLTTAAMQEGISSELRGCFAWDIVWIGVYSVFALLLYRLVVHTFDRSLGRATDRRTPTSQVKETSPRELLAGLEVVKPR